MSPVAIGTLAVILCLLVDPFTQQLVGWTERQVLVPSDEVWAPKVTVPYSAHRGTASSQTSVNPSILMPSVLVSGLSLRYTNLRPIALMAIANGSHSKRLSSAWITEFSSLRQQSVISLSINHTSMKATRSAMDLKERTVWRGLNPAIYSRVFGITLSQRGLHTGAANRAPRSTT